MAYLFRALIFVGVIIATVQCLTCNLCAIGTSGSCLVGGNVTCDNRTSSCFSGTANLTATGTETVSVELAGCVVSSACGRNISGSILAVNYTASFRCCNENLCNHASSLQLPLIVALCFATMTSGWLML